MSPPGYPYRHEGNVGDAEKWIKQALSIFAEAVGDHRDLVRMLLQLEQLLRRRGNDAEAADVRTKAEVMAARLGLTLSTPKPSTSPSSQSESAAQPSVNQEALNQAKEQVRQLFAQTIELARSNPEPAIFFREWLSRAVTAMGAHGGAVWSIDPLENVLLESERNLPPECQTQHVNASHHLHVLRKLSGRRSAYCMFPGAWLSDAADVVNPTPYTLVLAPLQVGNEMFVVEIVQRADAARNAGPGYAQYLSELCRVALEYLRLRFADAD